MTWRRDPQKQFRTPRQDAGHVALSSQAASPRARGPPLPWGWNETRSHAALLAILAASAIMAPSLAGESLAQTAPGNILEGAQTGGSDDNAAANLQVTVTFAAGVDDLTSSQAAFTVDGVNPASITHSDGAATATLVLPSGNALDADATPTVRLTGTVALDDDAKTYTNESVVATDGLAPSLASASVTGPRVVTVTYDERVLATIADYTALGIIQNGHANTPRNIMKVLGSGTDTHTITFYGTDAKTSATGSITLSDKIRDVSMNPLAESSRGQTDLADAQAPDVLSARVTGPNTIQVEWSEPLPHSSDAGAYSAFRIGGKSLGAPDTVIHDASTGVTTITFSGAGMGVSDAGLVNVGTVRDDATPANASRQQYNVAVLDGQRPALADHPAEGAETNAKYMVVSGPNTITIKSQERVLAGAGTFGALVIDADGDTTTTADREDRSITAVAGSGTDTLTLTFDGDGVGTGATATVTVKDSLTDVAGNVHALLAGDPVPTEFNAAVHDGQAPRLEWAGITESDQVTLRFSERMNAPTVTAWDNSNYSNVTNLTISGERAPRGITTVSEGTAASDFKITFDIGTDTTPGPVGVRKTAAISVSSGVADATGNRLAPVRGGTVEAAQIPAVDSVRITAPNEITAIFTEPVTAVLGDFGDLRLDGSTTARLITGISPGNGPSATYTLTFADDSGGNGAPTGSTATIDITGVYDAATPRNTIGNLDNQRVGDGQAPTVKMSVTGPNQLTAEFSEPVYAARDHFAGFGIGTMAGSTDAREITSFTGSGSTYTMTFDGKGVGDDAQGYIDISNRVADRSAANKFAGGYPGVIYPITASKKYAIPVGDGQAPVLESISITAPNKATAEFSEPVTAPAGGDIRSAFVSFRLSDGSYRNVNSVSPDTTNSSSAILDLTFGGPAVPTGTSGTIGVTGGISDPAGNRLWVPDAPGYITYTVTAGQIPKLVSAKITAANQITLVFSEPVTAYENNFYDLRLNGNHPRAVDGIAFPNPSTITLTFAGGKAPTGSHATIDISALIDKAATPNMIRPLNDQLVGDGQAPSVRMSVTGPNQLTAEFSERVSATRADFDNLRIIPGPGASPDARKITGVTGAGSAYLIAFDGPRVTKTDSTAKIDILDSVTDAAGNKFAGDADGYTKPRAPDARYPGIPVADGQAPVALRGEFASGMTIAVAYSEAVKAHAGSSYTGLVLGTDDYRNVTDTNLSGSIHYITYIGSRAPDTTTGTVQVTAVKDLADIALGAKTIRIENRAPPTLVSASVTDGNEITVRFSEPVDAEAAHFTNLWLSGSADMREVTAASGSGTDTIVLTFGGGRAPVGASGVMDVSSQVADLVRNPLTALDNVAVTAGQVPVLLSAAVTGPNQITLVFSEGVRAAASDFANLQLFPGGQRAVTAVSGSGSATLVLAFGGPGVSTDATAILDIGTGVVDNDGAAFAGASGQRATAGQPPALTAVSISSDNATSAYQATVGDAVTVTFTASETVAIPTVTIGGIHVTGVSNPSGNQWTASRTMGQGDADGGVAFTIDYTGLDGQAGARVTATTDGSSVTYSNVGLPPLHASSAVTGPNQITVTFTEPVTAAAADFTGLELSPGGPRTATAAAISGPSAAVTFGGPAVPAHATATLTLGGGIRDADGNALAGPRTVPAADGQAPSLLSVTMYSSNADPGLATVGDTVTLGFAASEPISAPSATINGSAAQAAGGQGNAWTASRTFTDLASLGAPVTFSIDYSDLAGNAGVRAAATTDGTSVSTGVCGPGQGQHPYTGACVTPLAGSVKVGLLLSEAPAVKLEGQEARLASAKAVDDLNAWLASQGRGWTLAAPYQDNGLDGPTTLRQIQSLKAQGVDVVLGVPTSASVKYVADYVNANGMVLVSCCSAAPSLAKPDGIFRMSPTSTSLAPLLAQHAVDSGTDSLVIIYRNDTWGNDMLAAAAAAYEARGGTVASRVPYEPGTADFAATARAAQAAVQGRADASGVGVLFLGWAELAGLSAAAAATDALPSLKWFDAGVNANSPRITADPAALAFAESTRLTSIQFKEQRTDATAAVAKYVRDGLGRDPSVYAYSSYDAVWVAGQAIDRAQSATGTDVLPHVPAAAAARTGGALGPNALDANGDLALRSFNLWAVEGGAWKDRGAASTPSIRGTVFSDSDGDGIRDAGEAGIEAGVTLYGAGATYTARSNAGGYYSFSNVAAGPWTAQVDAPDTHVPSAGQSYSRTVTVAPGAAQTVDFALEPLSPSVYATLSGTVFTDADGDGRQGAGEPGLPGYAMYAIDVLTGALQESTTGADGGYAFDAIPPSPRLTLLQATYFPFDHTLTTPSFYAYLAPARGGTATFDVGFRQVLPEEAVSLYATVYRDDNANGVRDPGEGPFPGIRIDVYSYTTNELEAVTTGAGGAASKTDIAPADWVAQVALPAGYVATSPTDAASKIKGVHTAIDPAPGSSVTMAIGLAPAT